MVRIPVYLNSMTDAKHLVQIAEACKKEAVDNIIVTKVCL